MGYSFPVNCSLRVRRGAVRWMSLTLLLALLANSGDAFAGSETDGKPVPAPTPASATKPAPTKPPVDPLADAYAMADAVDDALVKAVAAVQPSSVTVRNLKKRPPAYTDGPEFLMTSGGSGVLITHRNQGPFVISNEHVVRGADRLEVVMCDGAAYEVRMKDHVKEYDIALLEFVQKPKTCKTARFGKSESLREGQWVIATGNPFFLALDGRSVATLGVISGLDRSLRGEFTYANAIQHDAEVNPGNSGGPLWNLSGELIGINGMISSRGGGSSIMPSNTGASFAIPIHLIGGYLDNLVKGKAAAGYLGLDLADERDPKTGKPVGARISAIQSDSPIRAASTKGPVPVVGDVVTRFSLGTSTFSLKPYDVYCANDATNALALYAPGAKVRIRFSRNGKEMSWEGDVAGIRAK